MGFKGSPAHAASPLVVCPGRPLSPRRGLEYSALDFRPTLVKLYSVRWPGLAAGVTPAVFMTAGRSLTYPSDGRRRGVLDFRRKWVTNAAPASIRRTLPRTPAGRIWSAVTCHRFPTRSRACGIAEF